MKTTVTLIPTNIVPNLLSYFFCPVVKTKTKNHIFRKLVVSKQKIIIFLFIVTCALLQRNAEFDRNLKRNFLTCCSCSSIVS